MLCFPNAKINIGLNVTGRRNDGYHDLETVFYPIGLCDILEFIESDSPTVLSCSGISLDTDPGENILMKTYRLLRRDFHLPELKLYLHKAVPAGAGLGGGSSDAAFFLKHLNDHFQLGLSRDELIRYALQSGSDCAFFIENKSAFATGRGETLEPAELSLDGKYLILVNPGIHVSTARMFGEIRPEKPHASLKYLTGFPVGDWKDTIRNDFEPLVFRHYPEIEEIKNQLYRMGAVFALMTGSGSSVYGIFEEETDKVSLPGNYFIWRGWL